MSQPPPRDGKKGLINYIIKYLLQLLNSTEFFDVNCGTSYMINISGTKSVPLEELEFVKFRGV
jgi:hypothetical protein